MKYLIILVFISISLITYSSENFDLTQVSYKLAKELYPSLELSSIYSKLNHLEKQVRKILKHSPHLDKSEVIKRVIYQIPQGEIYYELPEEEGILSNLLTSGMGNCFSYSTLFQILGNKFEVKYQPVMIPGHVFLMHNGHNIETTLKGKNLSKENIAKLLHLPPSETVFVKATPNQFVSGLYSNVCLIASYKGDASKAIDLCNTALSLNPHNGEAHINLAYIYNELRNFKKALHHGKQANNLYPYSSHSHFILGQIYHRSGLLNKAINAYRTALRYRPTLYKASYNLANLYFDKGSEAALMMALPLYTQTIQNDPKHYKAYMNRGLTYTLSKNFLKAVKDFSKVIDLNVDYSAAYFERGRAYYNLGKFKLAIKDFTRFQELDPSKAEKDGISDIIRELKSKVGSR